MSEKNCYIRHGGKGGHVDNRRAEFAILIEIIFNGSSVDGALKSIEVLDYSRNGIHFKNL